MRRQMMLAGGTPPTPPTPAPEFHSRLVFDGLALISTNVTIPENGSVTCTFSRETSSSAQGLFSTVNSSTNGMIRAIIGTQSTSTNRVFRFMYNSISALNGTTGNGNTLSWSYNTYTLFITPKGAGFGDKFSSYTKGTLTADGTIDIGRGNTNMQFFTGQMATFRVYGSDAQNCQSYTAFGNYTPVATLYPCLYQGEAGLWHYEQGIFYGNTAGAGTLSVAD